MVGAGAAAIGAEGGAPIPAQGRSAGGAGLAEGRALDLLPVHVRVRARVGWACGDGHLGQGGGRRRLQVGPRDITSPPLVDPRAELAARADLQLRAFGHLAQDRGGLGGAAAEVEVLCGGDLQGEGGGKGQGQEREQLLHGQSSRTVLEAGDLLQPAELTIRNHVNGVLLGSLHADDRAPRGRTALLVDVERVVVAFALIDILVAYRLQQIFQAIQYGVHRLFVRCVEAIALHVIDRCPCLDVLRFEAVGQSTSLSRAVRSETINGDGHVTVEQSWFGWAGNSQGQQRKQNSPEEGLHISTYHAARSLSRDIAVNITYTSPLAVGTSLPWLPGRRRADS